MGDRSEIRTPNAPDPVGPYSQAVRSGPFIFASGQIPLDPASGRIVDGEIEDQTRRVLENLSAVLVAGGASLGDVVRTTVYVTDLSLFPRINAVYAEFFAGEPAPARATVQVAALPLGAHVEIDAIAVAPA
ncbi:MAG TPA: RidA family protein [Myxococcota bacterium]|nr:RidA family protein [Myxococcota bacterium]